MTATEELKKEHRGIEVMLRIAGAVSKKLAAGETVPAQHLSQIVEFLQIFADKCHHGKEEDQLFTALEQTGFAPFSGPIHVMLEEHKQGRAYIKAMAGAAQNYESDKQKYGVQFAENARGYVALLTQHIEKEDHVLYPMVDKQLSEKQQKTLSAEFEKIEQEKIGPGKHEEFHHLLDNLRKIYLA